MPRAVQSSVGLAAKLLEGILMHPGTHRSAIRWIFAWTLIAVFAILPDAALAQPVQLPPCKADQLYAYAAVQGATGALAGSIIFAPKDVVSCALNGTPTVQVLDAKGNVLAVTQINVAAPSGSSNGPVLVTLANAAVSFIRWSNFCASAPAPFSLEITLPGDGSLTAPLNAAGGSQPVTGGPRCDSSLAPSTIRVSTFATYTAAPHDNRFFEQTGFRIDNDVIWDYFNRRGGLSTFGYPVSRAFTFQGFTVQFFQRRIVQIGPDGNARLLNVLDPGLMPYSSFNGAVFPTYDSALVATAPPPANSAAVLAWIQEHAPNSFQGLPVNYYRTFLNTVPFSVAFPGGGNANLLTGFDLEMWGIPTSQPQFDPLNHNFVYLRFQRGIMHFNAGCNCTQGILLADYLKSILTGIHLPADLNLESRNSAFYKQYDPSVPNWVRNPSALPNTNLTLAFVPE